MYNTHQYKYNEVAKLHGNIVTTEKDAVKLAQFNLDNIYALCVLYPVRYLCYTISQLK